jgi:hypothetical protein
MHTQRSITCWALAGKYTWIWIMISRNSCNTALKKLINEDFLELKSHKVKDKITEEAKHPKRLNIKQLTEGFSTDQYELPWL